MKLKLVLVVVALLAADYLYADTHDVAFWVGKNSNILWFEIDNPSIGGSISVINQPYPANHALNAAFVDLGRNRLVYMDTTNGPGPAYAIDLTTLALVPNVTTQVTVSSLGVWPGGGDNAGYNKANGKPYFHIYNAIEVQTLNFDASGNISGTTSLGNINGPTFTTPSITSGDVDFDSSGNMWVAGDNSSGTHKLWRINPTTLTVLDNLNPPNNLAGIIFDAAGTTLYGYEGNSGKYGIIDQSTAGFQTVLTTNPSLFGNAGDLAEAVVNVVPEPGTIVLAAIGLMILVTGRRAARPAISH